MKPVISMLIPVYNEERTIERSLSILLSKMEKLGLQFEIIVANDGSKDGTLKIAKEFSRKFDRVRVFSSSRNMGRGEILSLAIPTAKGEYIGFTDADLATNLMHLEDLFIPLIKGKSDLTIGSRWLNGSVVVRTPSRKLVSFLYNKLVRALFSSKIHDHQCGFKAFRRDVILKLIEEAGVRTDRGWTWDTEILLRAQRHGYRIKEFPVTWTAGEKSTFKWVRDIFKVSMYLLNLRWKFFRSK